MTETQLRSLIGCILKFKVSEIIITDVHEYSVSYKNEINTVITMTISDFIKNYLPKLKIYINEDDESLVPIMQYLEHYDIK